MLKALWEKTNNKFKTNQPFLIIFFLILLFVCVYFFNNIFVVIHPGEGGVKYELFFGGTVVDRVYSEGFHLLWPWDKMYKYNVRVQQIAHEFDVLTKNGLKVHLYISIRYYPEYDLLAVLHQKVGPEYVEKVVIPEIEQVLRLIIGQMDAEGVYNAGRAIIEKSLNEATEQVAQRFIIVDNVIIKKIQLPGQIEKAIEKKMEEKENSDAYVYIIEKQQREAERKRIEAKMMKEYNEIVNLSLTPEVLEWMAIQATLELSKSDNAKVVVIGGGKRGLPILGNIVLGEDSDATINGQEQSKSDKGSPKGKGKFTPKISSQKEIETQLSNSTENTEGQDRPIKIFQAPDSTSQNELPATNELPDKTDTGN